MKFLKFPLLLLALLLTGFVLAACGGDEPDAVPTPTEPTTTEAAGTPVATADTGSADERYLRSLCPAFVAFDANMTDAIAEIDERAATEDDPEVLRQILLSPWADLVTAMEAISPPDDLAAYHSATATFLADVLTLVATIDFLEASVDDVFEQIEGLGEIPTQPPDVQARLRSATARIPECGEIFLLSFGAEPDEPRPVTFMLDWSPNTNHAGVYAARAKGWYEDAGIVIDIVQPGDNLVDQAVAAGVAQFGVSVQENVIPARAQGVPIVSLAAIIESNTSSLVALGSEGIARPRDLAGKTYGGWGGPLETALISRLVECDGGDPDAVEYAIIGNVDYLVGMEQDHYDFVWIFDGWDGIRYTEVLGEDVVTIPFIDHTECIPDWYTPVIIAGEDLIADDPDLVRDFMEATARGYRFAMENPGEAADILLEAAPELDGALVRASAGYLAGRYAADADDWGRQTLDVWTRFEAFLREAGLTETPIDVEAAFTNEFLP